MVRVIAVMVVVVVVVVVESVSVVVVIVKAVTFVVVLQGITRRRLIMVGRIQVRSRVFVQKMRVKHDALIAFDFENGWRQLFRRRFDLFVFVHVFVGFLPQVVVVVVFVIVISLLVVVVVVVVRCRRGETRRRGGRRGRRVSRGR